MISSLVDFSFIRSPVAGRYSHRGTPCYDPPSLFLVDLFRYLHGHFDSNDILALLRDEDMGRAYRTYAGFHLQNLPCEATLSNFRARLGEHLYQEIFHVMVGIFKKLEMITFKVLSHDRTLFPTWARYKGCTYFCDQCPKIVVEDVLRKVRTRILYRLNHLSVNALGPECGVYTERPSPRFPEDVNKPKVELFAFRLAFSEGEPKREQQNTAGLFGVNEELEKEHLVINTIRSNVVDINPENGAITITCPKLPKDVDARIGVRRDPQDLDKKQKIFGYNAVLSTSLELELRLELPVAVSCIAGNAEEGDMLIANRECIRHHHVCKVEIDIADSKFDATKNYEYIRGVGSIPIIDHNPRNENLSKEAILKRGYDQNGWPFAPCGLLCRPNGFDKDR